MVDSPMKLLCNNRLRGGLGVCLLLALILLITPTIAHTDADCALTSAIHDLQTKELSSERAVAANTLARLGNTEAVPALIAALHPYDIYLTPACVRALRILGDHRAVPALLQLLAEHQQDVDDPNGVMDALIALADPLMKEPMLEYACRKELPHPMRLFALVALEKLHDRSISTQILPLISAAEEVHVAMRAALLAGRLGLCEATPRVLPFLHDATLLWRITAVRVLGMLHAPDGIALLTPLLHAEESPLRLAALDALAAYQLAPLFSTLASALHDDDVFVRTRAATMLGNCGNAQAVAPLLKAFDDVDPGVRAAAAEGLGKYGQCAVHAVQPLLAGKSATQRMLALRALGATRRADAAPAIAKLLADADQGVREAAASALVRLGVQAAGAVLPLLKAAPPATRALAANVLGRMQAVQAIPALQALADDPADEVRLWGVAALGDMPNPPAKSIARGLQDHDPMVRTEAAYLVGSHHLTSLSRLLLRLLVDGTPQEAVMAHTSLCLLAGEDLGLTRRAWEDWVNEQEGSGAK